MRVSSLLLMILTMIGCSGKIKNRAELVQFSQDHKEVFVKSRKFKAMNIFAKCIPQELLMGSVSDSASNDLTFNFEIISPEQGFLKKYSRSYEEYRQYKWYLMNDGVNFIYLQQKDKIIRPKIALFEEQYELGRGCEYNIVFDKTEIDPNEAATFVYNDEIFGMGKLKFQFDLPTIMNLPINEKSFYNSLL